MIDWMIKIFNICSLIWTAFLVVDVLHWFYVGGFLFLRNDLSERSFGILWLSWLVVFVVNIAAASISEVWSR